MKIEICDNTFWLAIWLAILSTIVGLAALGCNHYGKIHMASMQAGYEEVQLTGAQGTRWVKTK